VLQGNRVFVVVPARNEQSWIGGVLRSMPAFVDRVIVVDDGSTDATAALARDAGASVLVHERSRGVGAAIISGYVEAMAGGADVVAVMAGDGQMCPDDLEALVLPVVRGEADYTKGNRFDHPDVKHVMPNARRRVGRVLSRLTGLAVGLPSLSDSQSGYTAISRRALEAIDLDKVWQGYGYPNDLLGHLCRARQRVRDVRVRPVYRGEASGLRARHVIVIAGLIARAAVLRATSGPAVRPSSVGSSPLDAPAAPTAL
jgi:dolichol-phosphate mannosyltransferase